MNAAMRIEAGIDSAFGAGPQESGPPTDQIGAVRALSELVDRVNLASRAGLTFSGSRDLYEALGYKRRIEPKDYRARYERGGIAERIVETFPKETWTGGGQIRDDENPDESTAFETAWEEMAKRLGVWSVFMRADILAGLGQYAVVLIGAPGELNSELPKMGGQASSHEKVLYLTPFSEEDVEISEIEEDRQNPRFGLPTEYKIRRISPATTTGRRQGNSATTKVHWTRVIHIADGLLSDNVYGRPRLRAVWNYLDDLDKVVGGGSEAFWRRADPGYLTKVDADVKLDPDDLKKIKKQVDEYVHGLRRVLGLKGTDFEVLSSAVANFGANVDSLIGLISATTGIPQRILLGSERGELSSTQDRNNFFDRIQTRRSEFAVPQVIRPLIERLIEYGALPAPKDNDYSVDFEEGELFDQSEKIDMAVKMAGLNSKAGELVVLGSEIREFLGFAPLPEVTDEEEEDVDPLADGVGGDGAADEDAEAEEGEPRAALGKASRSGVPSTAQPTRTGRSSPRPSVVRLPKRGKS